MKAFLLHEDKDFDMSQDLPPQAEHVIQDLELETLFRAMADGDKFLFQVAQRVVLFSLEDLETIRYRQDILADCLENASVVSEIYQLTINAAQDLRKGYYSLSSRYPSSVLHSSVEALQMLVERLRQLRRIADDKGVRFNSEGFRRLFAMLQNELSDGYFSIVSDHLKRLEFRHGVLMSATLGRGNAGTDYVLRKPHDDPRSWFLRIFSKRPPAFSFRIADRDESGARALGNLRNRGINLVANAAGQSKDHILSFFASLRAELAFYLGCLNLHKSLVARDQRIVFPEAFPAAEHMQSIDGMYDLCLALTMDSSVVANSLNADGKKLIVITGANQGGKSTFLRSLGLSQLMMQCGMFVPAESFRANICNGLFTHYRREEDTEMNSGKFDEELKRMSEIVDTIRAGSMMLLNESFAATTEREGSEIALQITNALMERGVRVLFVTHMYEYARTIYQRKLDFAMFLQPERQSDGSRTFRIREGRPSETSFGPDLYEKIFDADRIGNHGGAEIRGTVLDSVE
jgi:hypothetical protein